MTVLDAWLPYEEEQVCHVSYASMKEGIFALKGLEGAKWKWNRQRQGMALTRILSLQHFDRALVWTMVRLP